MRIDRIRSLLTVSTTILAASLLVLANLRIPPNRGSVAEARPQKTANRLPASAQAPSGYKTPLAKQRIAGGYWRLDHSFQSTLIITNFLQNTALVVTPVLYAADGAEYKLPVLRMPIAGVSSIDIAQALISAPEEIRRHFSDYGSAAVEYVWHSPGAISALVDNRDVKRSLNFNFELKTQTAVHRDKPRNVYEGIWWREDPGVSGFLALVNATSHPIDAQVQILSDYGAFESEELVHLDGNETHRLIMLEGVNGSSGGIRVSSNGLEKDLILAGGLENPHEGYSAQIPFLLNSRETKPSTIALSSVGLMLGEPDPMMKFPKGTRFGVYLAMRNTTSRPISIVPTLYYMDGPDVKENVLKPVPLAARQAKHWSPEELTAELDLPKTSGMINLVFSYSGNSSDVIIANGSLDETKNYVFEINLKGVGPSQAKELKDWDVSDGNDTMISLLNLDQSTSDLVLTFSFDGGHYTFPIHLEAGASTMLNVSDIIMMHQPDANGNNIPANVRRGTAVLSGASDFTEPINIGVSIGVFNVSTATCGGRCPNCTDYSDFEVLPYSSGSNMAPVGGTATFQAWGFAQDGLWHNVTFASSWSSDNTSVATSQGSGSYSGVSAGSFNAWATAYLQYGNSDCGEGNTPCPTIPFSSWDSGTIQALGAFQISVSSTPITGETNSVVSGQAGQVKITALDQNGATFTGYVGTAHFSSGDTTAVLPSDYTFTSTDAGIHTFSVTLKTVSGNAATRDLTVKDNSSGKSTTQNINVWFQVIATREGLVGGVTACNHTITQNDHFVALPATGLCNTGVRLRNGTNLATTTVLDVGPWCPNTPGQGNSNTCSCSSDRYWQTTGVPFAATASCATSHAGIDLADGTFSDLGLTNNGNIYWRFQ